MMGIDKIKMHPFFKKLSTFLAVIIGIIALFILGSLLPLENGYSLHVVESGSMEPLIKTGSVIAIIPRAEYGVGDVVTFMGTEKNKMPITHRINRTEERDGKTVFFTKGDANDNEDFRSIGQEEILGEVFLRIPYVGYLASFLQTKVGFITLIIVPLAIVGVLELFSGLKQIRPKKDKKND